MDNVNVIILTVSLSLLRYILHDMSWYVRTSCWCYCMQTLFRLFNTVNVDYYKQSFAIRHRGLALSTNSNVWYDHDDHDTSRQEWNINQSLINLESFWRQYIIELSSAGLDPGLCSLFLSLSLSLSMHVLRGFNADSQSASGWLSNADTRAHRLSSQSYQFTADTWPV